MLNFFKKKVQGELVSYKIEGMHCTSCAMNIDGELEDTPGIISAKTNYAKSKTEINYDPKLIKKTQIKKIVESLDYQISELK